MIVETRTTPGTETGIEEAEDTEADLTRGEATETEETGATIEVKEDVATEIDPALQTKMRTATGVDDPDQDLNQNQAGGHSHDPPWSEETTTVMTEEIEIETVTTK